MNHTFRSALNGFNREDVVTYLDFINQQHSAQINQLNTELEYMKKREESARAAIPAVDPAREQALQDAQDKCEQLEQRCNELQKQCEQLRKQLEEKQEQPQMPVQPVQPVQTDSRELEAYRRAEQVERSARERAERISRQTAGLLAEATEKMDGAACQVAQSARQVMQQLDALQRAMEESKTALAEAAAKAGEEY